MCVSITGTVGGRASATAADAQLAASEVPSLRNSRLCICHFPGAKEPASHYGTLCRKCCAPPDSPVLLPDLGLGVESQLLNAFSAVLFQVREQSFVCQIELVGMLPVMVHDVVQTIDNMLVPYLNG